MRGIDGCGDYFEKMLTAIPDVLMEHSDASIQVFKDGETIIWSRFQMQGSKVFELTGLEEGGNQKVVLTSGSNADKHGRSSAPAASASASAAIVCADITARVVDSSSGATVEVSRRVDFGVGPSKPPNCFHTSGTVTFHLNSAGKVYLIASIKD